MKINLNKVKLTPVSATTGSVCVFGAPDSEIQEWIFQNRLSTSVSDKFTNISLKDVGDVSQLFTLPPLFHAVDGFSPNLNKHLHLGHLSNFVFAKAFQSLGVGKHWFAVLGDTLTGEVSHGDAEKTYRHLCQDYGYQVNQIFHASKLQILNSAMLQDGTDEFTGCKVFRIGHDKQIVGVKSDGSTSYFYHDVAVAFELHAVPTLYVTGLEQIGHFSDLKVLFPSIQHLPLGHVTMHGVKMSSRDGNMIPAQSVLEFLLQEFKTKELAWNVLAGFLLKSAPQTNKSLDWKALNNPKQSVGLYLSYTLAKCQSAGLEVVNTETFVDPLMQMSYLYAKHWLSPHFLLSALAGKAKEIAQLYEQHPIRGNADAQSLFEIPLADLALGMQKLGMYVVDKV